MSDDQRLTWHQNWLALDDQHNRYLDAWSELNGRLERQPGWFALTDTEKDAAQYASGLSELEAHLRILHRRLVRSLRKMPTNPSRDFDAVLANLRVAERLSPPEEHAVVHGILKRAVRDLDAIRKSQ
ncbi:hypothetical protein [uncultured Brevundimonas sp.]|uniref:hypothetical protein n=1 Tax=uncultured Brevundimonas sp. TaxID=213418 RepID=UPI0025D33B55|nr:hypothetical protein [uncultured Brevundimonas sp.]